MKAVKGKYYFGGIRPRGMKSLSSSAALEALPVERVVISTSQSLGKPAVPVVKEGQTVKEGELIARADGRISSDVFSSLCGVVREIKELDGETHIVVEADGRGEKSYLSPLTEPDAGAIKARIRDAGIVGLGGAGFPTAVKADPQTPVDTLIVNGAECEPYLTCDYRLMIEKTEEIARGARYVAAALGIKKIIIGIEANKPDAIAAFEKFDDIQPVILKKQYPMGGERQLTYVATGRKVGGGKLPLDAGVVVQNAATCFAVCEAIELGKPLYERALTVSGAAIANPKNLWVRVGTDVNKIVEYCGGELAPKKAILGGPMTGVALASLNTHTRKTTSAVLLLSKEEAAAEEPTPCINCGKCADVCPMRLMPMNTAFYSAAGDFEAAAKYGNVRSCIECGACEYVCPARRPLIQAIRKTKAALRAGEKKSEVVKDVADKPVEGLEKAAPENLKDKEANNG